MKGWKFVFFIFIPIALITTAFFYFIQPRMMKKPEATLRCYVKFSDQNAVPFLLREDVKPHAVTLTFNSTSSIFTYTAEDLRKGKNWIPHATFPEEEFAVVATSPGYHPLETLMVKTGGQLLPSPNKVIVQEIRLGEDFIGLNMERIIPDRVKK